MMIAVENGDYCGVVITVCEGPPGVKLQCMNRGVAGEAKGTNGTATPPPPATSPTGNENEYFKFKKK